MKVTPNTANDVLLHEMVHQVLHQRGSHTEHNSQEWCDEINRIGEMLGLRHDARPVKVRRIPGGKTTRSAPDGWMTRGEIARWPHSLRPEGHYETR